MISLDNRYRNVEISSSKATSPSLMRSKPLSFEQNKWFAKMIENEIVKCLKNIETAEDDDEDEETSDSSYVSCGSSSSDSDGSCLDPSSCHSASSQQPSHFSCYDLPASEMTIDQLQSYVITQMPQSIRRKVPAQAWDRIFGGSGTSSHCSKTSNVARFSKTKEVSRTGLAEIALRQSSSYRKICPNSNEEEESSRQDYPRRTSAVSFGMAEVRYYDRCLDLNPAVSIGPAIGLDWTYSHGDEIKIDDWEKASSTKRKSDRRGFVLSSEERIHLLLDTGYTQDEIAEATKDIALTRNRRAVTLKNLHAVQEMEDALETASRRVKQLLSFGKKRSLVR